MDYLIIAGTWFALGFGLAAILYAIRLDKDRMKLIKKTEELIERNNELIEQNKRLISFNNHVTNGINDMHAEINYICDLLKG